MSAPPTQPTPLLSQSGARPVTATPMQELSVAVTHPFNPRTSQ